MQKTILITGSTDGIGLDAAKLFVAQDHHVILHGRNADKLANVKAQMQSLGGKGTVEGFTADLSNMKDVEALANDVSNLLSEQSSKLDVLINNAGVFKVAESKTAEGLDVRFMVNTFSPLRLTQLLLSSMDTAGRVLNLSSAAQASVRDDALTGKETLGDMDAYAQSKLAITMWSQEMAKQADAPIVIAVNPGSMLGTNMVKAAFGSDGHDISIGSNILFRLALDAEFKDASGLYFDNDAQRFGQPHSDALNSDITSHTVELIQTIVDGLAA